MNVKTQNPLQTVTRLALTTMLLVGIAIGNPVLANHEVLVEGNNCADGGPGVTTVPPGTCGDFDGDGRIGTAENTDNATDRIFGTINAALGNTDLVDPAINATRANQNGRVLIVTSGRFRESVTITAANGNVQLEAAPGVDADIDAVVQGLAGNDVAQGNPGIIVNAPDHRRVTIRNVTSRNWTDGIQVLGTSHVTIDDTMVENNRDNGIRVTDSARATIVQSNVNQTGFREGVGVDNTPNRGTGVLFEGFSRGAIENTTISGSFGAGLVNASGSKRAVKARDLVLFDNHPDRQGPIFKLSDF